MTYAGLAVDEVRGELQYGGRRARLQEQPRRLLRLLLARPAELVEREQIRVELWGSSHVDHEHGINTAVRKLRRALESVGAREFSVVTSAGQGYRLVWTPVKETPGLEDAGYQAFLSAQFLFSQRDPASLWKAKEQLEFACERHPGFARAHASLSRTCRFLTIFEASDPGPLWEQAERHAHRAVALEPELPEAQSSHACVLTRYRWQWEEGFQAFERALELNPNEPDTRCDFGVALLARGDYAAGARVLDRVLELDPRYATGRVTVALGWMLAGRREEARAVFQQMTETMPAFLTPWIYLGIDDLNQREWAAAERCFEQTLLLAPGTPTFLALLAGAYAGLGRGEAARSCVERMQAGKGMRYVSPTAEALGALALGERAEALRAVERAVEARDANFPLYRRMAIFDGMREERAFERTLKAMRVLGAGGGFAPPPRQADSARGQVGLLE